MRKVVEALRLAFDQHWGQREIAMTLALSQSTEHESTLGPTLEPYMRLSAPKEVLLAPS